MPIKCNNLIDFNQVCGHINPDGVANCQNCGASLPLPTFRTSPAPSNTTSEPEQSPSPTINNSGGLPNTTCNPPRPRPNRRPLRLGRQTIEGNVVSIDPRTEQVQRIFPLIRIIIGLVFFIEIIWLVYSYREEIGALALRSFNVLALFFWQIVISWIVIAIFISLLSQMLRIDLMGIFNQISGMLFQLYMTFLNTAIQIAINILNAFVPSFLNTLFGNSQNTPIERGLTVWTIRLRISRSNQECQVNIRGDLSSVPRVGDRIQVLGINRGNSFEFISGRNLTLNAPMNLNRPFFWNR